VSGRADGPLKVSGGAKYSGDLRFPGMAYGVLVQSSIARGRVVSIDSAGAALPGVILVLTKDDAPQLAACPVLLDEEEHLHSAGQSFLPLQDDRILYSGQPLALVVGETREIAAAAAARLSIQTEAWPAAIDLADPGVPATTPLDRWADKSAGGRGDLAQGLAQSVAQVDATYVTAFQHHNPMEPHATIALWQGGRLTVYEPTTWVQGMRNSLATWFDLPEEHVRVIAQFVGGSFGCKGPAWPHVALTAMAARLAGRPVQLSLSRRDAFTMVGHRPRIEQRIRLGATNDGVLTALGHDALTHSSVFDNRVVAPVTKTSRKLYACPNVATSYQAKQLNLGGPFTMRGPGETPGLFALESAMDELAVALGIDPVALRLKNDTPTDPETGRLWSSRGLAECFRQAGERFGWQARDPRPGSMRRGETLVGWGTASMAYDARTTPATAKAILDLSGTVTLQSAICDQGTGSYTIFPQIAAEVLNMPAPRIQIELGDSDLPQAPISAGSMTAASVGSAVKAAAVALRAQLLSLAIEDPASPLHGLPAEEIDLVEGRLLARSDARRQEGFAEVLRRHGLEQLKALGHSHASDDIKSRSFYSFGAHFVEVLVDPLLGNLRVSRVVSAFAAGRILNPKLAQSQLQGGIVWGLGMALHEESRLDLGRGRIMNARLADYLVPVNADMPPEIDAFFVLEEDGWVNPLGVKGIGEIGTIGIAAALANAVYHATGRRIRELPITVERLLPLTETA